MVLTVSSSANDTRRELVKIRVLADTVGAGRDLFAGAVLEVPFAEYLKLKQAGKAELAPEAEAAPAVRTSAGRRTKRETQ